jgi:hypothetical protein
MEKEKKLPLFDLLLSLIPIFFSACSRSWRGAAALSAAALPEEPQAYP